MYFSKNIFFLVKLGTNVFFFQIFFYEIRYKFTFLKIFFYEFRYKCTFFLNFYEFRNKYNFSKKIFFLNLGTNVFYKKKFF